jgi:predicted RNase H-like nuclease (RuvC/YqgF family)
MSRRQSSSAGVSLFPFLSILACLIGVLTMMIKIITDLKSQETVGRDEQEMNRAKQHQQLRVEIKKQQQEIEKIKAVLKERNAALVELSELENKRIVLRKKLADEKAKPKESDKALQKLLEQLLDQIASLRKERPQLEKELAELKKELERRKIKPDTKPQPVRINPAGSGLTANTQLLFIECNKNGLVILDKNGSKTNVSAATITTDGNLAAAFNRTKSAREHLVLFLIRADGSGTFRTAGAHAETKFNLRIGKLPVPTQGEIDLSLFLRK